MTLAITGGTGCVGRRVLFLHDGQARALARSAQPPKRLVWWVAGDLADTAALARLCDGASAVIHIAGVVNARDRAGFEVGNVAGTANILTAAEAAGVQRFVHVSSVAAREPSLSMYGASKAAAEALVAASPLDWIMVRPPAVYGPGDRDMLDVYRLAARGWGVAPGPGRFSLIHADDLARALLTLASAGPSRVTLEIDDRRGDAANGYGFAEVAQAIGAALGTRPRIVPLPVAALTIAATVATAAARLTGALPTLSRDRARYLAHPDWVARGGNTALADIWTPQFDLAAGIGDTVAGYRGKGWL